MKGICPFVALGCEMAMALQARWHRRCSLHVTLVASQVLSQRPARVRNRLTEILLSKKIKLVSNSFVSCVNSDHIDLNDGTQIPFDVLIWFVVFFF